MKVTVIGTGYVGLNTGAALAYLGHQVTCLDVDQKKLDMLKAGKSPIYEPGLEELLGLVGGRMTFTTSYSESIPESDVVFITVGTPSLPSGAPDLKYLRAAAQEIGKNLSSRFAVVVNKSTVPIGSGNWVGALIREAVPAGRTADFAVASNPEFLREGSALHDTFYADRVAIGADDSRALAKLTELYRPLLDQSFAAPQFLPRPEGFGAVPLISTDLASAELIKYSANAFLALKISFANEIANLAQKVGADILTVTKGMGLDSRIGTRFLNAGIGWGGSCFGKDTAALIETGKEYGLDMAIVRAGRDTNYKQRERVIDMLLGELKIIKGRTISLMGLAFKPDTDDLRDAPAVDIARKLIDRGAIVKVHDPVAMHRTREEHPALGVQYCNSVEDLAQGADALVVVTEWKQYRDLDWASLAKRMRTPLLLDGRNHLDRGTVTAGGFTYLGIGR